MRSRFLVTPSHPSALLSAAIAEAPIEPEQAGWAGTVPPMPFHWDWLKPVVHVPYVPTLGPVHPATLSASLFEEVLSVAGTGQFLPYDKDMRWSAVKEETVLVDAIDHSSGRTLIPAVDRRGARRLTVYAYGCRGDAKVIGLAFKLAAANDAATARVFTFCGPEGVPPIDIFSVRVWLSDLNLFPPDLFGSPVVGPLDDLDDEVGHVRVVRRSTRYCRVCLPLPAHADSRCGSRAGGDPRVSSDRGHRTYGNHAGLSGCCSAAATVLWGPSRISGSGAWPSALASRHGVGPRH